MVVDFAICGTQKGGTTALDAYLRQHPEVCMACRKEVHFFDTDSHFAGGAVDYSQYHAAFEPGPAHRVLGEATPVYMYWHDAPRRIWQYNPRMKLIVLLRNPMERAYSHWNMEHSRHADPLPFGEALAQERERCRAVLPLQHRVFSYVDRGFYTGQLRRLWTYFPAEQLLILKSDELKNQPLATLNRVCAFQGVHPFQKINDVDGYSLPYASPLSQTEQRRLRSLFEFEIRELERLLGWDCSAWLRH